jgi:hypothetical protein
MLTRVFLVSRQTESTTNETTTISFHIPSILNFTDLPPFRRYRLWFIEASLRRPSRVCVCVCLWLIASYFTFWVILLLINGKFIVVQCCGPVIWASGLKTIESAFDFQQYQRFSSFFAASRLALGSTHPPMQRGSRLFYGDTAAGAWSSQLTSSLRMCGALPALPIRLHGVVLN